MTSVRLLLGIALATLCRAAAAGTGLDALSAPSVGGSVTVAYPTSAPDAPVRRGPFTVQAAVGAPPVTGNRRLVVLSHGSGGSPWPQFDLARTLVQAGFTVAMPEHAGDNARDPSQPGPASWRQRPAEVSAAIDAVAADPRFAATLDLRRVGVYGMSAGGLTALTMAGGRWSPARMAAHCDAHLADDFPTCVGLATALTGGALDTVRLVVARAVINMKFRADTQDHHWHDPRIAAAVAAVPMAAVLDPASLAPPRIPLGLVRAGRDAWLAPRWHIDAVHAACAPACRMLDDQPHGGHGMTLSPAPPGLPPRAARLLDDPPGFDRAAVLPGLYGAIARFFAENLAP